MNEYSSRNKALILLQDGTIFFGKSLGVKGNAYGELCFNTGMTGYQEIFTDPSYFGQLIVTTNAHIGNYGVNAEEVESDSPKISGLICKNFNNLFSRPAADDSLQNFFVKYDVVAISDVDTRALVSYIRDNGAMNAVISTDVNSIDELKKNLQTVPSMVGMELASKVSTKESYFYGHPNSKIKIAALDLGVKKNILRNLSKRDTYIKVFPYNSEPLKDAIKLAKNILKTKSPLFGICLGHQVIALANGISTYKMHNGHRGINHPIINLSTGKGEVTSQNHGFAINREETELNDNVEITHVHLNDNTIAGIKIKDNNCFSVQYHPEASPGPHDSSYLFDEFVKLIKSNKKI
jgi:carbamoyl-phosphate synthase small subunit